MAQLGLISSTYIAANNRPLLQSNGSQCLLLASIGTTQMLQTTNYANATYYVQAKHPYT